MKKSQMFYHAQLAVLRDVSITFPEKLEILRVLADSEDLEKYREKQKEKEKVNEAV
jgi:hypothetical protein